MHGNSNACFNFSVNRVLSVSLKRLMVNQGMTFEVVGAAVLRAGKPTVYSGLAGVEKSAFAVSSGR
jgi:hypothetical protein